MYRLYSAAGTGAIAPEVMLEEAGAPFERVAIELAADEHRKLDFLTINPAGEVPVLRLPDDTVMTGSAAMALLRAGLTTRRKTCSERGFCAGRCTWRPPSIRCWRA